MNRNRLLLIGVFALTLGAFVSYFAYQSLKARANNEAQAGVDVIVAADDLQVGSKIEINDVIIAHYPEGNLPPGYFRRFQEVISSSRGNSRTQKPVRDFRLSFPPA
jgi:Flp pilus assembly protein CpaB